MAPELPFLPTETSVAPSNNKLGTIAERRAKRLLDRVQKGETLSEAANNEHMKVADLKDPRNPVRQSVEQLVGSYFLPPEARKQMVRAGLNKIFLTSQASEDPAVQKLALDAAKQIAADPEVGLQQDQTGGVVVNIGELSGVFAQLKSMQAPEVKDGRDDGNGRQIEDRITEGEYEDIPDGGSESIPISTIPE